ncbi:MAG: hypothetical protein ACFFEN_15730 [Candidatus Thorarchaeota archaeon]
MTRQKKGIKRVIFFIVIISVILISNVQILNHSNLIKENANLEDKLDEIPISSDIKVNDLITGSGDDQDVRIYANNKSQNLNNNQKYFEIPSLSSEDMYLSAGDFNFTFQNNFTAEYIIEDDDALYAEDFIAFNFNEQSPYSGIIRGPGTTVVGGNYGNLVDDSDTSSIRLNATNGILNFTIRANFTGERYRSPVINGYVSFNRAYILGLIFSLLFDLTSDANLTIKVKNFAQSSWKNVIETVPINSSLGKGEFGYRFINENLNFIDLEDITYLRFIFERNDLNPFIGRFYNFELMSTFAFDLPITNTNYVALEFDLKGEKTIVNGFYAWIRTLNLTEAATSQLNFTLYRSNGTIKRTESNLRNIKLSPAYNEMIDSKLVSYTNDNLSYFEFNIANTENLNLSNYFVVIKSTNPLLVYSLVALPFFDYGDDRTEHQLITTSDDGATWNFASKKVVSSQLPTYRSGQLDASSFKLNVTRGYMPSDFSVNGNKTLRIQDRTMKNLQIEYPDRSNLTWGLGRWYYNFSVIIEDTPANMFQVYLKWNKSITKSFEFNVSYSVNAYWIKKASSSYTTSYNQDPEWVYRFNLDKNSPNFNYWTYLRFYFIYPTFVNAHNLTNPNGEEIYWRLKGESILKTNPSKYKLPVDKKFSNLNGTYILNLTSYNFIHKMHSYINYEEGLWETNGFMYGDNISIGVDIQDHLSKAPKSGNVNATLFYPNGTKYPNANFISSIGLVKDSVLSYDFNNLTILDLTTEETVFGKYQVGFFWSNGSAIGSKKLTVYIDTYDIELTDLYYSSDLKKNIVVGEVKNKVFQNYTILIASVNDTTGIDRPNFYPINNSDVNKEFIYEIGDYELPVLLSSFKQNENILNPNEVVNFKTVIRNMHSFIPVDVNIKVSLVSPANEEWIIAETVSNTVRLEFSGHPNDNYEFDVNLTIPNLNTITKIWKGLNAPIRLSGAKALVTVFIEGNEVGTYESPDYCLFSNQASNQFDGNILGIRINEEATSQSILNTFNRNECIYLPNATTFLVNIYDRNFVSSYNSFKSDFTLKLNSKFNNITINPEVPRKGETLNMTTVLTTEFGDELPNRNVTCQFYFNDTEWIDLGSDFTDKVGFVSFIINTIDLDFEEDLLLKLSWNGDSINEGISKNVTIEIIHDINNISVSIRQNDVQIYKNEITTLSITVFNIGNSDLRLYNISLSIDKNLNYSIVEVNYIKLDRLTPGEHSKIVFEIEVTDINRFTVIFTITAQNFITGENITFSKEAKFKAYDAPIFSYFVQLSTVLMIALSIFIWIIAILYIRRVRKRIEEPVEEVPRRLRRGRYVPVAELKKPPVTKAPPKKKEEVKQKKTTDLDSLLEERGLTEKEKKKKQKK